MTLTDKMIATFGQKNLVYGSPEQIHDINLPKI